MLLALTGQTVQNIALGAAIVLSLLTVLALIHAFRDPHRKSPRCRKCGYLMDRTRRLRCPECGWETQKQRKLYFRRLSRRWMAACLVLLITALLSFYITVVQERISSLNEPYAAAWVPTTWHALTLPYQDGSNDQVLLERLKGQGWDWQKKRIRLSYCTLYRDTSQPTQRLTESIEWSRSSDHVKLEREDIEPLADLIDRGDPQLTTAILTYLLRMPVTDMRVGETAISVLEQPSTTSNPNSHTDFILASYLLGRHKADDTSYALEHLSDPQTNLNHKLYFDGVLSRTLPIWPDEVVPAFEMTQGYELLLDKVVAKPGSAGNSDAAKSLAHHLRYDFIFAPHETDPTEQEIRVLYEALTTPRDTGIANGAFDAQWDYEDSSLGDDYNEIHLGLVIYIIKLHGEFDPRIGVILNQFLHPQFGYGSGTVAGGLEQIPRLVKRGDVSPAIAATLGRCVIRAICKMHEIKDGVFPMTYTPKAGGGAILSGGKGLLIPEGREDLGGFEVYKMWQAAEALIELDTTTEQPSR
jgi:hypothetical protein